MSPARSHEPVGIAPALALLTLCAFAYQATTHALLSDDAFISYRYARHLVDGLGLVWNPGEAVEGYSNFLWVMLTALGMELGFAPEGFTRWVGVGCALGLLVAIAAHGATLHGWRCRDIWWAPLGLACNRSFAAWSTSGLETLAFALFLWLGYASLVKERERGEPFPIASSLWLALASITRADGGLFTLWAGLAFLAWVGVERRGFRSLVIWCLPWLVVVGSHFLWRHGYYGYWLPNTYYAKVNEFSFEHSLTYFRLFAIGYHLYLFLPLAALAVWARRDFRAGLFTTALLAHCAYLFYVGGDFLEYRFLVPILPFFYWLVVEGALWLRDDWRRGDSGSVVPRAAGWAGIAGLIVVTLVGSASSQADKLGEGLESLYRTRTFARMRAEQGQRLQELVEAGTLPASLRIQTGGAGALPYYTDWYTLDKRGLNDVRIAREPIRFRARMGHQHLATPEYTLEREIEAILINHRFLFWDHAPRLQKAITETREWVERANREVGPPERFHFKCIELEPDYTLVFATTLDDARFEERVGRFRSCAELGGSS